MTADTIAALSSGAAPCGVAIVRVSGPGARGALAALAGSPPAPRRASLRRIRDAEGQVIDHGLVLFFDAPNTATGEDIAEFHLHGGRAVVARCLAALVALPIVRLAQAGEFTRRAFDNGRIDLTEAEGLADLLAAETEAQRRQAIGQAGGTLRRTYEDWSARLLRARALLEASFDFADEGDVSEDVARRVRPFLLSLEAEMESHLAKAEQGEILRRGFRVAITGAPNAGKSSLLNALADREVAIVSERPGTTRDVLEVLLDLGGIPIRLFDTAGLRQTDDEIEAIGIERALRAAGSADLVLRLEAPDTCDAMTHVKHSGGMPAHPPSLRILTKLDLGNDRFDAETDVLRISSKTGAGVDDLCTAIAEAAAKSLGNPDDIMPSRVRHREIIEDVLVELRLVLYANDPAEIAAENLRRAGDRLGSLTGRTGVEELLGVIFSEFCIGK